MLEAQPSETPSAAASDDNPAINACVEVQVRRLLPFGLLIELADGRRGIVREREIAWDKQRRRNWRTQFRPGDRYPALFLGADQSGQLEFSLRLAENDPWHTITSRYELGALLGGVVTGIQPYGVFVELEPGISGLLHRSRLPAWAQTYPNEELFWPGDRVRVVVELIDPLHRRLGLSLARAWPLRWQHLNDIAPAPLVSSAASLPTAPGVALDQLLATRSQAVLVVEDDAVQLEAVASWLRHTGQRVTTAANAEAALEQLARGQPDLVLVDLGLPVSDGITALHTIGAGWPQVRRALMTDWARADEHLARLEELRELGVPLLLKPLLPEDLVQLLAEPPATAARPDLVGVSGAAPPVEFAPPVAPQPGASQRPLREQLAHVRRMTGATTAILFMLDPAQRQVSISAASAADPIERQALVDLIYSPVRDVAEDRQTIKIADAGQVVAQVRYMRPLLNFRSCLGVPVNAELAERYALFLFSPQPEVFSAVAQEYAQASALMLAALLERRRFQLRAVEIQRLALLGQLSRALVHELNHQLSPINFALHDLQEHCTAAEEHAQGTPTGMLNTLRQARLTLGNLVESVRRLTGTARLFGRMTIQSQPQFYVLSEIAQEVCQLVRDMADRARVRLTVCAAAELTPVPLNAVQVQQILLNIVINAVQQIDLLRPNEGGQVCVAIDQPTPDRLLITVEDDGPGIHQRYWERIFELGFTTRSAGGSGMGLYVTRSLVEALGGRVYVRESVRMWGTTMAIELPTSVHE